MVNKRGLSLILLFVFVIFSMSFISAEVTQCVLRGSGSCLSGETLVMKLSGTSNAHGELPSQNNYDTLLCCNGGESTSCSGSNEILKLSANTNAHAETKNENNYNNPVCYGDSGSGISYYVSTTGSCQSGDFKVLSISDTTNAHLAKFTGTGSYDLKICGSVAATVPEPDCGDGVIEGTEECDDGDTSSGDGCSSSCQEEDGWSCTGEPSVCTEDPCSVDSECPSGEICSSGSCVPEDSGSNCVLQNPTWGSTSVTEGDSVTLYVGTSQCVGESLVFEIKEYDLLSGDNSVSQNPSPLSVTSDGFLSVTWQAEWQAEGWPEGDPPEYYFDVWPSGDTSASVRSSDPKLEVEEAVTPKVCGDGTVQTPNDDGIDEQCDDGNTEDNDGCSSTCQNECVLNSASWSTTDAVDGEQVSLNVDGQYCDGQTVTFEVKEHDGFANSDDNVENNPSSVTFGANSATGTWIAEWPGYTDGETTPEYYFTASIPSLGLSITSSQNSANELHVTGGVTCGNGLVEGDEVCDGSTRSCSINGYSGTQNCNNQCDGWDTCQPTESCGDGIVNGNENCDGSVGGETCEDIQGSGWTGDLSCSNSCSWDTSGCSSPPECVISSVSWSESVVEEGTDVFLNVQTANCNDGEAISFEVREDDNIGSNAVDTNPENVQTSGNIATGTWEAEFHDDSGVFGDGNPPEYYFTATVVSNDENMRSNENSNLQVLETGELACFQVNVCDNYDTPSACEADSCNVGPNSNSGVSCGPVFDESTRCLETTNCGCTWDGSESEGSCVPSWDSEISCNACGNGVLDFNEQCDDGNTQNGDGCSAQCEFENGISPPCLEGTTLCEDNTCSLNCDYTDDENAICNYDGIGQEGEGCSCADWNGEQDACVGGLLCSFEDGACCNSESDGECIPSCAFVDPDCGGDSAVCGNGLRETGEQCDDGNTNDEDGCSSTCTYEVISGPPCPEGTTLCANENTCSLNCDYTDGGYGDCSDGGCCATGLDYSGLDNACCNSAGDSSCNPYCASVDPDCGGDVTLGGLDGIGQCVYTKNGTDNCDDGYLTRDYASNWVWNPDNSFDSNPDSSNNNYVLGSDGKWHYDPIDLSGVRKSENCEDISDRIICPAQVELPFFGKYNFVAAIILIALIYVFIVLSNKKKKHKNKTVKKKK